MFGSRPRRATMRWYSSGVSPCCSMTLGSIMAPSNGPRDRWLARRFQRVQYRFEDDAAILASEQRLDRALGVRHHAHDVPLAVADARNRVNRAIGIPGV